MTLVMECFLIPTIDGIFTAHFSDAGLARLEFPAHNVSRLVFSPRDDSEQKGVPWRRLTQTAIEQVLRGATPEALPPIDLTSGTDFQREVWEILRTILPGKTMTYAEVAAAIRRPKAVRAVGQACGANPIPMLVPCHRVLAAQGGLGGFSAGLVWKIKLLEREGVRVRKPEV
jgi:O-6-methylguanine DNA methyltransferase